MKKIFKCILLLLLIIVVVRIFVYFLTKPYYKEMNNIEILVQSPKVQITESKADKNKGYIQGMVTNDTGKLIDDFTLKFDFYNHEDRFIGSESHKVGVFNVGEKSKFDIKYEHNGVTKIVISVVK